MVAPNVPTPGSTTRSASATSAGSRAIRAVAPSRAKAASTEARLAVPVGRTTTRRAHSTPLVLGT